LKIVQTFILMMVSKHVLRTVVTKQKKIESDPAISKSQGKWKKKFEIAGF